jgi:hypothetical protein
VDEEEELLSVVGVVVGVLPVDGRVQSENLF